MDIFHFLYIYRYVAIFFGATIEGPILMVAAGFFVKLGHFNAILAFLIFVAGDVTGDFIWYAIGRYFFHPIVSRFGKYFDVTEELVEKMKMNFNHHDRKILFLSKLTMGFGFAIAIMLAAGASRVSLKTFGIYNLVGSMIWTALLMSVGYFFGQLYQQAEEGFRIWAIAALSLIILLAFYGFSRYMRKTDISKL
jgi:membrane protein DedA with SNARE-associated domain